MFDAMINPFHLCADIQCIYLFKSLHIQYKMHSRDGHFVQIDFSLPLFPFSKFANVDTIFEQNSLPGEKPLSIWHETFWQPGRIFWRFKKSQAWKHLSSLTLPETNSSHLKNWLEYDCFLLRMPSFRCYVCFRECNVFFRLFGDVNSKHLKKSLEIQIDVYVE